MNQAAKDLPLPCHPDAVETFLSEPQPGTLDTLRQHSGDILVIGAGGKMGLHLCLMLQRALDQLGRTDRVWAASRFQTLNSSEAYEAAGITTLAGDFRDEGFRQSLPRCPLVFYLVGAKFGTSDNPELLQEINVDVARELAAAFRNATIVAFSTGCVYSFVTPDSGGATEQSPTEPVGEYALSCLERERQFVQASEQWGTPVVLIRLNYSVEFRYGVLVDVAQKVLDGEAVDLSTGYANVIWQGDALNQIIECMSLADSPAVPVNITGPDIVRIRDLGDRFGELFDKTPVFKGSPEPTAWLSNASWSHQLFGKPAVDLETMTEWVAAWLAHGGSTHGKPTGFEKRDGRF